MIGVKLRRDATRNDVARVDVVKFSLREIAIFQGAKRQREVGAGVAGAVLRDVVTRDQDSQAIGCLPQNLGASRYVVLRFSDTDVVVGTDVVVVRIVRLIET